jgi:hypothetical protein
MTDTATNIRPSACGRFVVVSIGAARPHVLPLADAETLAEVYRSSAKNLSDAAARLELATAAQLELAVGEAKGRI